MFQKLLFLFLTLSIFSCGKNYHFEKTIAIENTEWQYTDTLNFEFNISDTTKIYNILLEVNHSSEYSFQNMYLEVFTAFPEGQRIREMVSLELANRAGVWFGNCNAENCSLEIPIQEGAFFNQAGGYVITTKQFMRKNPLNGVRTISLKIEDTGIVK